MATSADFRDPADDRRSDPGRGDLAAFRDGPTRDGHREIVAELARQWGMSPEAVLASARGEEVDDGSVAGDAGEDGADATKSSEGVV